EANAFRKAADDVLAGASLGSIADRWNEQGFLTPRGKLWAKTSVRIALLNPKPAGLLSRQKMSKTGTHAIGYDILGTGAWPAIISVQTHNRLTKLLTDKTRRRKNPPRHGLLTGYLRCGRCDAVLHSDGTYYRCLSQPERPTCAGLSIGKAGLDE